MHDAYIAGLLDGEGSIMLLNQGPGHPRRPQLSIGMTEKEPIMSLKEALGGFVRIRPESQACAAVYCWKLNGARALDLLERIRPHLTMARRQKLADMLLHDYPRERGGTHGVRAAQIEHLFARMQAANAVRQPQDPQARCEPSVSDCAYLAGILDGEGHITPRLRTEVTSTDPEMLDWCQARFGGAVYQGRPAHGNRRATWVWHRAPTGFPRIVDVAEHMHVPAKQKLVQQIQGFSRTPPRPKPLDSAAVKRYKSLRAYGVNRTAAAREAGLPRGHIGRLEG